jgi:aminopeptidase N
VLDAEVRIEATATQKLRRFNLDLRGFDIARLEVNGKPATFARAGEHELVITPHTPLITRHDFTVEVEYSGVPQTVIDPDESFEGWVKTADGAFVVNEPQGSPGWFPVNDNPNDKATFDFAITVPEGKTALANGVLVSSVTDAGRTTWRWSMRDPISPYLTTATNGDFTLTIDQLPDGTPIYNAIAPGLDATGLARQKEIHAVFSELFGPYPFEATGAIVDRGGVGYALETATKANYDVGSRRTTPSPDTVVHEISHEWFGNSVTLARWRDIWLNEGFARFSQWIFTERTGGTPAATAFRASYNARPATHEFWTRPPADLGGPEVLFDSAAYDRGGMTLQALRETIGDADFFALLRTWVAENAYGNVTTQDFIATAERVSGEQLDAFFEAWLFTPARPPLPGG